MGSLPLTFGGLGRRRHGDCVQGAAITVRPSSLSNWARCTPNTAGRGMRQARTPSPPPSFLPLSLSLSLASALSLSRASRPLPSLNVASWIVLVAVRSERGRESDDGVRGRARHHRSLSQSRFGRSASASCDEFVTSMRQQQEEHACSAPKPKAVHGSVKQTSAQECQRSLCVAQEGRRDDKTRGETMPI